MNNIKTLREQHKESAAELGAAIGKSQPTISNWENNKKLKYEDAMLIAKHYNVSVDMVLGKKNYDPLEEDMVSIDVLDAVACCGTGVSNFETNIIGKHLMTRPALNQLTTSSAHNIKIMRVIGESMKPTINPDDNVWIDVSYKTPSSDGLYLIRVGDDLMVKRIQINPFNNSIDVTSDNPKYKSFSLSNYHDVAVLGKVIYHVQKVG